MNCTPLSGVQFKKARGVFSFVRYFVFEARFFSNVMVSTCTLPPDRHCETVEHGRSNLVYLYSLIVDWTASFVVKLAVTRGVAAGQLRLLPNSQ